MSNYSTAGAPGGRAHGATRGAGADDPTPISLHSERIAPSTGHSTGGVSSTLQAGRPLGLRMGSGAPHGSRNHASNLRGHMNTQTIIYRQSSPNPVKHQMGQTISYKDPRFAMYSRDTIRDHLDRRRRRAQSTARPRQRFSTITALHKGDVQAVTPGSGQDAMLGKRRTSAISQWSSGMNPNK